MKVKDDSNKLCVLVNEIGSELLLGYEGSCLYYIPVNEYKLQVLKNNVNLNRKQSAYTCYRYAMDNLYSRFEIGEEIISKCPHYSYYYALHVLRGRFELGEKAVSKSAMHSYWYARDVIKERFEIGEETVKRSSYKEDYEALFNIKI